MENGFVINNIQWLMCHKTQTKPIHRGKAEKILLAYGLPKETVIATMIIYKKHEGNGLFIRW